MKSGLNFTPFNKMLPQLIHRIEINQALRTLSREIEKISYLDGYYISLVDEKKENLTLEYINLPQDFEKLSQFYLKTNISLAQPELMTQSFMDNKITVFSKDKLPDYDEGIKARFKLWKIHCAALVPISDSTHTLGQIFLFSNSNNLISDQLQALKIYFSQFVSPLMHSQVYSRLINRENQIDKLYEKNKKLIDITAKINTLTSVEKIQALILKELLNLFSFDMGGLFFQQNEALIPKAFEYSSSQWKGIVDAIQKIGLSLPNGYKISLTETSMAIAFIRNQHYYINNFQEVSHLPMFPIDKKMIEEGMQGKLVSNLQMPIRENGVPIGMLVLSSFEKPCDLSEHDIMLIESLCSFIPSSINNSKLYSLIEKQSKEIEAMNEITKQINLSLDYNLVLDKISDYLKQTYQFEGIALYLVDHERANYIVERWDMPYHKDLESYAGKAFPLDAKTGGRVAEAILTNRVFFMTNIDPAKITNPVNRWPIENFSIKTILHLPIPAGQEIIGSYTLTTQTKTIQLSETDIQSIQRFINQIGVILKNSKIYSQLQEKNRIISEDLMLARNIQDNLISKDYKNIQGIDFFTHYLPQLEVGGDIFDIFQLNHNTIRIFIADATGHGVQAAFSTILISSSYEMIKHFDLTPDQLIEKLNQSFISRYYKLTVFFSCFIIDIDLNQKKMIWSSAGHPGQYLITQNQVLPLNGGGKLAGLLENSEFKRYEADFKPGDKLILFTDGLYEEFNAKGEELEEEGLYQIIEKLQDSPIQKLGEKIFQHIWDYVGSKTFNDDITLIGLEFKQ